MSLRNRAKSNSFDNLLDESEVKILEGEKIISIPKDFVYSGEQVRKDFNEESIKELSLSLEEHGQLQPIVVFPVDASNKYKIHQGERRWRAALASDKITHIQCIVRSKGNVFQQLAENIQRENLNAIEIGQAIRNIKKSEGLTGKEVAEKLAISAPMVSMFDNVVDAPDFILDAYREGIIGDANTINELRKAAKINNSPVRLLLASSSEVTRKEAEDLRKSLSSGEPAPKIKAEKQEPTTLANFELSKGQKAEVHYSSDSRNMTFKFNRLGQQANEILLAKIAEAMDEIEAVRED